MFRKIVLIIAINTAAFFYHVNSECCPWMFEKAYICGIPIPDLIVKRCHDCTYPSPLGCCARNDKNGTGNCNIFCCNCNKPCRKGDTSRENNSTSGNETPNGNSSSYSSSTDVIGRILERIDWDMDGRINFPEFDMFAHSRERHHIHQLAYLEYEFSLLDVNKDGFIDPKEIDADYKPPPASNTTNSKPKGGREAVETDQGNGALETDKGGDDAAETDKRGDEAAETDKRGDDAAETDKGGDDAAEPDEGGDEAEKTPPKEE